MKKIASLLLILNSANNNGMLQERKEAITVVANDLTRSMSYIDLPMSEQQQQSFARSFLNYVLTSRVVTCLTATSSAHNASQTPLSPREPLLQGTEEELDKKMEEQFNEFLALLTVTEEKEVAVGEALTQQKNEQLVNDASTICKIKMYTYLSGKKKFINQARPKLIEAYLKGRRDYLANPLDAPKRISIIKSTVNHHVSDWLNNIEHCVQEAQNNFKTSEDLSRSIAIRYCGELELNLNFLRPDFDVAQTAKEKKSLAQIITMAERALHAAELNGLDSRVLGEVMWTIWSNLCIKIQDELKITLTEFQLHTFRKEVLKAQQTLINFWCQCAKISKTGMKNEGRLPAKFEEERKAKEAHELELKRTGQTIKPSVDKDGIRKKEETLAPKSQEEIQLKEKIKATLLQNLVFRIKTDETKKAHTELSISKTPPAPPKPPANFILPIASRKARMADQFQQTRTKKHQQSETTSGLLVNQTVLNTENLTTITIIKEQSPKPASLLSDIMAHASKVLAKTEEPSEQIALTTTQKIPVTPANSPDESNAAQTTTAATDIPLTTPESSCSENNTPSPNSSFMFSSSPLLDSQSAWEDALKAAEQTDDTVSENEESSSTEEGGAVCRQLIKDLDIA